MQNFNLGSLFLNGAIDTTLFVIVVAILVILVIAAWLVSWKMSANNLKVQYEKQNGDIETQRNKMRNNKSYRKRNLVNKRSRKLKS